MHLNSFLNLLLTKFIYNKVKGGIWEVGPNNFILFESIEFDFPINLINSIVINKLIGVPSKESNYLTQSTLNFIYF